MAATSRIAVQRLVTEAEKLGLRYVTATIGTLDLESHVELIADIAEEVLPADTIDDDDDGRTRPTKTSIWTKRSSSGNQEDIQT